MTKIYKINSIIKKIKKHQGSVVVCGCSDRTKEVILKYKLSNKINYILDNDTNKLKTKYFSINVINYEVLNTIKDPLIVIWGNYISLFYNQVKNLKSKKILIEKQKYLNQSQNISNLLDTNFTFEIEYPNYKTSNEHNNSHKFIPILIQKLLYLNANIKTKVTYHNNKSYLKKREPDNNTFLFSYHSVGEKHKNVIRYKEGYLHNMITFDTLGHSGWSSLCHQNIEQLVKNISQTKADNFFDKFSYNYISNNISKYNQPSNKNSNFPSQFIFFPLQTINDSVMLHSYFEPIKLIKKIIKILSKQHISIVIKKHPRCNNKELNNLLIKYQKEKKIILFNGSIHDAISKATTIYTINSGVGFESLFHLKPVVTFGKSDYMNITKNIKNLDSIQKEPFYFLDKTKIDKIKRFLFYYINNKCLFIDDEIGLQKIIDKIIMNNIVGL